MAVLYIPVGIPASGKSSYAKNICAKRISSDDIRKELFGSEDAQYCEEFAALKLKERGIDITNKTEKEKIALMTRACNEEVFSILNDRCYNALRSGESVYYDATNLIKIARILMLEDFFGMYDKAVAIYFDVPVSVCVKRNEKRNRTVPESVIYRMAGRLEKPCLEEGFDEIVTVKNTQ